MTLEVSSAVDAVRARLESTFGKAVAMLIMASASNSAGVPTVGMTPGQFTLLAEAVCNDQRVVDMWGAAGAQDALKSFKDMLI